MLGTTELLLLGGLALLIFGGKKVPEMMRGLGQGVKEFKKGMKDDDDSEVDNNVKTSNDGSPELASSDDNNYKKDVKHE